MTSRIKPKALAKVPIVGGVNLVLYAPAVFEAVSKKDTKSLVAIAKKWLANPAPANDGERCELVEACFVGGTQFLVANRSANALKLFELAVSQVGPSADFYFKYLADAADHLDHGEKGLTKAEAHHLAKAIRSALNLTIESEEGEAESDAKAASAKAAAAASEVAAAAVTKATPAPAKATGKVAPVGPAKTAEAAADEERIATAKTGPQAPVGKGSKTAAQAPVKAEVVEEPEPAAESTASSSARNAIAEIPAEADEAEAAEEIAEAEAVEEAEEAEEVEEAEEAPAAKGRREAEKPEPPEEAAEAFEETEHRDGHTQTSLVEEESANEGDDDGGDDGDDGDDGRDDDAEDETDEAVVDQILGSDKAEKPATEEAAEEIADEAEEADESDSDEEEADADASDADDSDAEEADADESDAEESDAEESDAEEEEAEEAEEAEAADKTPTGEDTDSEGEAAGSGASQDVHDLDAEAAPADDGNLEMAFEGIEMDDDDEREATRILPASEKAEEEEKESADFDFQDRSEEARFFRLTTSPRVSVLNQTQDTWMDVLILHVPRVNDLVEAGKRKRVTKIAIRQFRSEWKSHRRALIRDLSGDAALQFHEILVKTGCRFIEGVKVAASTSISQGMLSEGESFMAEGELDDAIKSFKTFLMHDPCDDVVWYNLGCCYEAIEDYAEARRAFDACLAINPTDPDYFLHAGQTAVAENRRLRGHVFLSRAFMLDPELSGVREKLEAFDGPLAEQEIEREEIHFDRELFRPGEQWPALRKADERRDEPSMANGLPKLLALYQAERFGAACGQAEELYATHRWANAALLGASSYLGLAATIHDMGQALPLLRRAAELAASAEREKAELLESWRSNLDQIRGRLRRAAEVYKLPSEGGFSTLAKAFHGAIGSEVSLMPGEVSGTGPKPKPKIRETGVRTDVKPPAGRLGPAGPAPSAAPPVEKSGASGKPVGGTPTTPRGSRRTGSSSSRPKP